MNTELLEALDILEKEKNISKDVMLEAIENSLLSACKNHFGTSDNIKIVMDRNTCDYSVYAEREVVEEVFDPAIEISLEDAEKINPALHIGDIAQVELHSKDRVQIIRTYCNTECKEPDSSEDQRRRAQGSI